MNVLRALAASLLLVACGAEDADPSTPTPMPTNPTPTAEKPGTV